MSGGSYEYMYSTDRPLSTGQLGDIARMARRLHEMGHADAAARTELVWACLRRAKDVRDELADVWYAVEWIDSGDWSEGDEVKQVESWRAKHAVPPVLVDTSVRLGALEQIIETLHEQIDRVRSQNALETRGEV